MGRTVLLIEDDPTIADFMEVVLEKERYHIRVAETGMAALTIFQEQSFDLILLDLGLPDIDGMELLKIIRKRMAVPLIVISARSNESEKVKALDLGADDYVTKPFDIKEVLARVAVQIRRMEGSFSEGNLVYQGLELDRENFCVRVDQTELPKITRQEFSILELLLKHPKKVFSKEEIFEYAWEEAYMGETKTLDVHISNIRKKIKSVTSKEYIETIWGIGYRLHP